MFEINKTKPTEDRLKETEQVKTSKDIYQAVKVKFYITLQYKKYIVCTKIFVYSTVRLTSYTVLDCLNCKD